MEVWENRKDENAIEGSIARERKDRMCMKCTVKYTTI